MGQPRNSSLIQALETMKVFPKPGEVESTVAAIRARQPNGEPRELARRVVRSTTARLTGVGAVAALPGAVPGPGTAAQIALTGSTITGETWLILRNLTAMQLTVAALYGHDIRHADRRDELVVIWGLETGVIVPATEAGKRIGTKIAVKQFNQKVSGAIFKKINQKLGTTVLTKWGAKRGGVAVGRLIPFGVGSVVGGGVNYLTARGFGAAAVRYYADLLPGDEDVVVAV